MLSRSNLLSFTSLVALLVLLPDGTYGAEPARIYKNDFSNMVIPMKMWDNVDLSDSNFENSTLFLVQFHGATLQRCNFQGADLKSGALNGADLTDSDLRSTSWTNASLQSANLTNANFSGVNFLECGLERARMVGTKLVNARGFQKIDGVNFAGADLRGADLSRATSDGAPAIFRNAKYDKRTRWPAGFDIAGAQVVLDDEPIVPAEAAKPVPAPVPAPEPKPASNPSAGSTAESEKRFVALDVNADGVLSGKEARPYAAFDLDQDGDVTKAEFIAGSSKAAKP